MVFPLMLLIPFVQMTWLVFVQMVARLIPPRGILVMEVPQIKHVLHMPLQPEPLIMLLLR